MGSQFLLSSNQYFLERNIYANKSSLVLDWLLREGIKLDWFSVRQASRETCVSVGLVQRVFSNLVYNGYLRSEGVRTSKRFCLKKPRLLLESWLESYNITEKCRIRTYMSAFQGKEQLLDVIRKSDIKQDVVLALHSAAEALKLKHTNINTLEIYMLDPSMRLKIEDVLQLTPKERGYEVLLIEPYYDELLRYSTEDKNGLKVSPAILTFLDLYNFPLRGHEQAEFMAERLLELQRIYMNGLPNGKLSGR